MECIKPVVINGTEFPCGHCRACRVNHTREWALRLMHERLYWEQAAFVTLTYSDDQLPADGGLWKRDLQLFIKRMRKDFGEKRIKYFAAGEYGETTMRPHYHLIMFGVSPYKDREVIESEWDLGFVYTGNVSYHSCRYVAQYCQKKLGGEMGRRLYGDRQPPFQLQSKGLGLDWAMENKDRLVGTLCVSDKGKKFGVPRYYKKKLNISPESYDRFIVEKMNTDDDWFEARGLKGDRRKAYIADRRKQKDEELKQLDERKNGKI